jgi:DNA-binding HxlR family transcriptional regulator
VLGVNSLILVGSVLLPKEGTLMFPQAGVRVPVSVAEHEACPATSVLRRIGDKWSPVLLSVLAERSYGFNELDRAVEGLSRRMLTRTLRALEEDGLVSRTVHPSVPQGVEYALTPAGRALRVLLVRLGEWAIEHDAGQRG